MLSFYFHKKFTLMKLSKNIIIEEIEEQKHPEAVEDVIFWALEYYAKHHAPNAWGTIIASCIVQRIKDEEKAKSQKEN
jgi:hypothetical protein